MEENTHNITFPKNWNQPKYQLGQLVRQGWIVGMRYYPKNSAMGHTYHVGWHYDVVPDWLEVDATYHTEKDIESYSPEETVAELQAEIDALTLQIEALQDEMNSIKATVLLRNGKRSSDCYATCFARLPS